MENNQKYTENARALIDRLRIQCTNHNNPSIMPAHLLLELSAPGTRSAELMERLTGADKLADLLFTSQALPTIKAPTTITAS